MSITSDSRDSDGARENFLASLRLAPEWERERLRASQESLLRRSPSPPAPGQETGPETFLDGLVDWLRHLAWKALAAFGLLSFLLVLALATLTLAYRWVCYGMYMAKRSVFGRFADMYRWLDAYSPSETEEEREEKMSTLRARVQTLFPVGLSGWYESVLGLSWLDLILAVAVVVLGAVGLYGTTRLCYGLFKKWAMRARGIQFEAMKPGSEFTPSKIPSCQVGISIPGLLFDAHQAYGTRIANFLVTNLHVVAGYTELVLTGPGGKKLLVRPSYTQSRMHSDLVYMHFDQATFAQLGATSAKGCEKAFLAGFATCYGPSGQSTGRVSKTAVRGVLIYEGSTVPGMSGAPYLMQGNLVGIHQGASGNNNLGISAELLRAELPHLVTPESMFGPSPKKAQESDPRDEYETRFRTDWKFEDLDSLAGDRYSGDSWERFDEDDSFWTRKLEFEAKKAKPASISIHSSDGTVHQIPLKGHSEEGVDMAMDVVKATDLDYLRSLRVGEVGKRLEALEARVAKLEGKAKQEPLPSVPAPTGPVQRFPCAMCSQVCRTEMRLASHMSNSHPVKGESAIAEDTGDSGKTVAQKGSFLEKRPSPKKKKSPSLSTSKSKASPSGSASLAESLSLMRESQQSIERLLRQFLAASAGQSSATMLN